jgi:hypothetical protein
MSYTSKTHFNIIFSSKPKFPKWSLPFSVSNQNSIRISDLYYAYSMLRSYHPPLIWLQLKKMLRSESIQSYKRYEVEIGGGGVEH